jgi:hypothetical protein
MIAYMANKLMLRFTYGVLAVMGWCYMASIADAISSFEMLFSLG